MQIFYIISISFDYSHVSRNMARNVNDTFVEILVGGNGGDKSGMTKMSAMKHLADLRENKRYLQDVWAWNYFCNWSLCIYDGIKSWIQLSVVMFKKAAPYCSANGKRCALWSRLTRRRLTFGNVMSMTSGTIWPTWIGLIINWLKKSIEHDLALI